MGKVKERRVSVRGGMGGRRRRKEGSERHEISGAGRRKLSAKEPRPSSEPSYSER